MFNKNASCRDQERYLKGGEGEYNNLNDCWPAIKYKHLYTMHIIISLTSPWHFFMLKNQTDQV